MRFLTPIPALLVLAAAIALAGPPAEAAEPMRVVIPASALNTPAGGTTLAASLATLTATVGETTCTTVNLTDGRNRLANGDKLIELGLARTQPGQCGSEGATLRFYDGRGRELATELALRAGATETLSNLAPKPPGTGTRGLVTGTVSVQGRGLLTGRSIEAGDLFVLIAVPAGAPQPVELAIVEWAVVLDETGHFYRVLDPGDYWLAAPVRYPVTNANAAIEAFGPGGARSIGVREFRIAAGQAAEVDVVLSAVEFDAPAAPAQAPGGITPPRNGDGGLR